MAASFSANAKSEVCRGIPQKRCCALAECFGILLFCNSFSASGIRIITESCDFAQNLPRLFKKAFGVTFDIVPDARSTGKMSFHVTQPEKIKAIMSAYGFDPADTLSLHINLPVVEDECCKASFFRGAFLAGGSVTDPVKGYHLELTTTHHCVAREAYALIHEVMNFYPKAMQRGGAEILYLKNSELISDFLTFLGAPICAMSIMETRLEKLSDLQLAKRMSKYISTLQSIRLRADYYSLGAASAEELSELSRDYRKVRDSLRDDARYLNYNKE